MGSLEAPMIRVNDSQHLRKITTFAYHLPEFQSPIRTFKVVGALLQIGHSM